MKKIEEREKLLDDLAFNLNVSVSDVKEALKPLTPVFDNEVQEKYELAKTYAEKYKNKFFRDKDCEYGCGFYYVRINNITYNPDFDTFCIIGESLSAMIQKIGTVKFFYEPCYKKTASIDMLSQLKIENDDVVHNHFKGEMEFLTHACRNFLPQD